MQHNILITILTLITSICSQAMEQDRDAYAQKHREQKVPEISKEEPPQHAREDRIKPKLRLVVGSTRTSGSLGPIIDRLYHYEGTDLSHRNTFKGKATSLDLFECAIKGVPHIIADARTFDFSKYLISAVFIEKMSTTGDVGFQGMGYHAQNHLGEAIKNIARSMKSGVTMDIEWLPEISLSGENPGQLQVYTQANPFHCFLNINIALQSIFILGGDVDNAKMLSEELVRPTLEMVEQLRRQLEFYHRQGAGVSVEELISLLYFEAQIILDMIKFNAHALLDYDVRDHNIENLQKAYEKVIYATFPPEFIRKKLTLKVGSALQTGIVYDQSKFLEGSFLNFVIEDLAAANNRVHVRRYLESLDFKDIAIEKGNNPHNGRKNVWMIKATKP